MPKSQINSTIIVYVVAILVVGLMFIIGMKFFMQAKDKLDKTDILLLKSALTDDINSVIADFGSIKKKEYDAESDLYLCFIDLAKKEDILKTQLISYYPLMKDALTGNIQNNVYVFTEGDLDSFFLNPIVVEQFPHFACFFPYNRKITVTYEGRGKQVNVHKNLLANITLNGKADAKLKSPDNMLTIEIPKDANPSMPYLSIQLIEAEDIITNEQSGIYQITPFGISFEKPITLKMYFTRSDSRCPKSLTYYQESADGEEHLSTKSYKVDCELNLAWFKINRFI